MDASATQRGRRGSTLRDKDMSGVRVHSPRAGADPGVFGDVSLVDALAEHAAELGFVRVGHCPAAPFTESEQRLTEWLAQGHHGEMSYLSNSSERCDPRALLPEARSVLVGALPYPASAAEAPVPESGVGSVARYARGPDYHSVIRRKLHRLGDFIATHLGRPLRSRVCVDTAPILEREAARRAGIAFIGKNTLAIAPGVGSNFLLGVMLIDVDLPAVEALADGCGSCTACLEACPTQAFVAPHQLDARRCISYLTIELKGAIAHDVRPQMGNHIFGCDRCQDACPYNKASKARPLGAELPWLEHLKQPKLSDWLGLTAGGYRRLVRGTALRRSNRERLQRNAAIALGNAGQREALPQLIDRLLNDKSTLVRQHCAWAIGRIGGPEARAALQQALKDPAVEVRQEAELAIQENTPKS